MTRETHGSLLRQTEEAERPSTTPDTRLWALLARLETLEGIPGTQAQRDETVSAILDIFAEHPQAVAWQRAWRSLHPAAPHQEKPR